MKGKIIAVPFPFTNLKGAKVRPALVIYEGREDVIVAFISSKIPAERYNVDVLLTSQMPINPETSFNSLKPFPEAACRGSIQSTLMRTS